MRLSSVCGKTLKCLTSSRSSIPHSDLHEPLPALSRPALQRDQSGPSQDQPSTPQRDNPAGTDQIDAKRNNVDRNRYVQRIQKSFQSVDVQTQVEVGAQQERGENLPSLCERRVDVGRETSGPLVDEDACVRRQGGVSPWAGVVDHQRERRES